MNNRSDILRKLISDWYSNSQVDFAKAIKKPTSQVNHWLTGYRNIGDGMARHIEKSLRLNDGYLDGIEEQQKNSSIDLDDYASSKQVLDIIYIIKDTIGFKSFLELNEDSQLKQIKIIITSLNSNISNELILKLFKATL